MIVPIAMFSGLNFEKSRSPYLILELSDKLINAKLKLKREEIAIRGAILRRDQEVKNDENQENFSAEQDLLTTADALMETAE